MTKILTEDNNGHKIIRGVETPYGIIKTNVVLNAAGAWSGTIARMIGLDIPLSPMKHAYIVTEPMNVQGLPNIRDPDRNIYFRVQGGNLNIGGYESNPIMLKCVSCMYIIHVTCKDLIAVVEKNICDTQYNIFLINFQTYYKRHQKTSPSVCTS